MKKFISISLSFALLFLLLPLGKTVDAACDRVWSLEEMNISANWMQGSSDSDFVEPIQEDAEYENPTVDPLCGGGKLPPAGWGSVLSGARLTKVTSSGTQNYVKNATTAQASREFNKLAPGSQVRPYPKDDGSVTFVKTSPQGDIRLYQASSHNGATSISWHNQKIRYLD